MITRHVDDGRIVSIYRLWGEQDEYGRLVDPSKATWTFIGRVSRVADQFIARPVDKFSVDHLELTLKEAETYVIQRAQKLRIGL